VEEAPSHIKVTIEQCVVVTDLYVSYTHGLTQPHTRSTPSIHQALLRFRVTLSQAVFDTN